MVSSPPEFVFYHYNPSLPAAAFFAALFGLSTILHFYQCSRTRTWYTIPLLIAGICECIGYIGRAISHSEAPEYSLPPYIIQSILILVAPALLAASVYMILGYIVRAVEGESRSIIKNKFLTVIFVTGDIFSFLIQSTGAAVLTKKKPSASEAAKAKKAGTWIIVGGLAFQLIFFGFFMFVSLVFYRRMRANPTERFRSGRVPWRKNMFILYTASIFIMVRSVFRVVEYVQGEDGYLLRMEVWLYVFDATLMASVMLLFNIVYPSEINALLKGQRAVRFLLRVQTMEKLDDGGCEGGEARRSKFPAGSGASARDVERVMA